MKKNKEELRSEIREELEDSGMFVVSPSMNQFYKTNQVLEKMKESGEITRGDSLEKDFEYPRNVYVLNQ